ncbi:hypothetical protein ACFDR9_004560 [Janthinobacterium sp. CG_23.3]|uniref:hypothetical protein n=1 Tax=unclassified Janthinobacterium TaxID=2610881 RepID=UPI0003489B44|nr:MULTISPECIES: hypothetical protein [unclassified Janthinobacterium]MEC5160284.1 hypothetical protein [Janthinobacterium sp. CG_S6]
MAVKPVAAVPPAVRWALALALALQLLWHAAQQPAAPAPPALPPAPAPAALRLASLGEPEALSKALLLYLQAYDDQDGRSLSLNQLDYARLEGWLEAALALDPRGQYPLLLASQVYAAAPDPARVRRMLAFVERRFGDDPDRRWPWLAHAALVARHRLHDLPLARRYAAALRLRATGAGVPAWARQLEVFIAEDMNEFDSAKALIGGLLQSGHVSDPRELAFLERRLQDIAARQKETRARP